VITLFILAAVEMYLGLAASGTQAEAEILRYAMAVLIFTPTIALLGAKRPQNAAWQFIVVTLWGVLALPAIELWMRGRGEELEIDVVRSWFLVVMIVIGAVNHFPTRFRLAAAQSALAQIALMWPHLPFVVSAAVRPPVWLACGLFLTSVLTARHAAGRVPHGFHLDAEVPAFRSWSLVWREFRDWYGAVWGVRVMERINASAEMQKWPVLLGWDGFVWRDPPSGPYGGSMAAELATQQPAAIEQTLRNLLRRFVSLQWIEARLNAENSSFLRTSSSQLRSDGRQN
jgi:hypothetical protein